MQARLPRHLAHGRLLEIAQGEKHARVAGGIHPREEVALVFQRIAAAGKEEGIAVMNNARVVSRGDGVAAQAKRLFQQARITHRRVASYAGIRGAAACVLGVEVVDDLALEAVGLIHEFMSQAERLADTASVVHRFQGAATALGEFVAFAETEVAEGRPDDFGARVAEQERRHRRIHAPADCEQDTTSRQVAGQ